MPELCNGQLVESLAAALETMAFVSLMPAEGPIDPPADAVLIQVDYHGPSKGRIELVTSQDLGRLLLDNTVGCDPSDTLVMPNPTDPLVELLNITCGNLLNSNGGGKFEMAVPRVVRFNCAREWQRFISGSKGACDVLMAEGSVIAIRSMEE